MGYIQAGFWHGDREQVPYETLTLMKLHARFSAPRAQELHLTTRHRSYYGTEEKRPLSRSPLSSPKKERIKCYRHLLEAALNSFVKSG